jgi:dolichol-phosphate mannosyltransferase
MAVKVGDVSPDSAPRILPIYSFVIPVHNEEGSLPELRHRLNAVLQRLDGTSEVILVDDGSTDASWAVMVALSNADNRYKAVQLSRNFGHQVAITAGMDLAAGDAVLVMDADLQDPPEVTLEMAERWREGYEVVYGVREDRTTDSVFKRTTASAFYRILARLTDVDIPQHVGDFRLIDRRAVEAFRAMREGSRFVRGMYAWVGFRQVGVPYRREARFAGETKYPLKKMLRLAGDGVVGFSRVPLRIALKLGALTATLAVLGGIAVGGMKLIGDFTVPGWTSILVAVCLLGGLQLAVLGVLGQYLGRTYEEALRRPLYIVSHLHGIPVPIQPLSRAVIAEPSTLGAILGEPSASVLDRRPLSTPS